VESAVKIGVPHTKVDGHLFLSLFAYSPLKIVLFSTLKISSNFGQWLFYYSSQRASPWVEATKQQWHLNIFAQNKLLPAHVAEADELT
jgi:hypothetical protein